MNHLLLVTIYNSLTKLPGDVNENKNWKERGEETDNRLLGFFKSSLESLFARRRIFRRIIPWKGTTIGKIQDLWLSARGDYPPVDAKDNRKCFEVHATYTSIACPVYNTRSFSVHLASSRKCAATHTLSCSPPWTSGLEDPPTGRWGRRNVVKRWSSIIERWTHEVHCSLSVSRSLSLSPGRRHRCRRRHGRMYL